MSIKENIKKLREIYRLSQQDLADIAGVTNKAVSSWENGNSEPRMGALERIAARFNIKKSAIIEEGGLDNFKKPITLAAHFEGEDYTEEEMKEIIRYAQYLKSNRKEG